MESMLERIEKIEKILFNGDKTVGKGLFYDYIFTRRLIKILSWLFGFLFTALTTITSILIKYNIDLVKEVARLSTLLEELMKR